MCERHVVFTPKYRKKLLFGKIKQHLGRVSHDLARRKEWRIEEGHLMHSALPGGYWRIRSSVSERLPARCRSANDVGWLRNLTRERRMRTGVGKVPATIADRSRGDQQFQ